jgi:hypothetical protein
LTSDCRDLRKYVENGNLNCKLDSDSAPNEMIGHLNSEIETLEEELHPLENYPGINSSISFEQMFLLCQQIYVQNEKVVLIRALLNNLILLILSNL